MKNMTIKECREFVEFVSQDNIKVKYSNEPYMKYCGACACISDNKDTILLSRSIFMNAGYLYQKSTLLHEIGHFVHRDIRQLSKKELYAELWAIKKANSMQLYDIKSYAIEFIKNWEIRFLWNKDKEWRKYIIASKMYNKMKGPKNGKVN